MSSPQGGECGVNEIKLARTREALVAKFATPQQAKPWILRTGEAQEKIARQVGQAAKLHEAHDECLATTERA